MTEMCFTAYTSKRVLTVLMLEMVLIAFLCVLSALIHRLQKRSSPSCSTAVLKLLAMFAGFPKSVSVLDRGASFIQPNPTPGYGCRQKEH